MEKLIFVALKHAPIHTLLLKAYRSMFLRARPAAQVTWIVADEYQELPEGDHVIRTGPGRELKPLLLLWLSERCGASVAAGLDSTSSTADSVHILVQSPHPANAALMSNLRRRFPKASIRYYLHEPTGVLEKIRKRDGLVRSCAVYLTQLSDVREADQFYVAHERALDSACRAFGLERDRGAVLPLPLQDLCGEYSDSARAAKVLFLGRADNTRCLDLFLELAREAARRGSVWRFKILTGSDLHLPETTTRLPNLEVTAGRPYSNDAMTHELRRARYVFNLFRVPYTQSGVTPVALMFGVPVIASAAERIDALERAGCLYYSAVPSAAELLDTLHAAPPAASHALREYYLSTFDARSLQIPGLD